MKRIYTLLTMLLMVCTGAWAETVTWESKAGWTQASGGQGGVTWFGVHTPGDATTTYSLTAIDIMQQSGGNNNNDNYLAIARVSASSSLNAAHVVAISDNHLAASKNSASLETYNFSSGVQLLGGTTYYFVFLSSNTPTDGNYTVRASRLSVNHTSYGTYTYGCSSRDWWPYFTATLESSATTGFCTGDKLGGTTGSGSGYKTVWTSSTSPSFTLTSSAANINGGSASGGLDIRSGKDVLTATYTITAPTGYVITGYKLFGNALNGDQTVTPAEGGSAVVFTSAGNSISVSGIKKASPSFTLAGANDGLFLRAMQVSLSPLSGLTTLPTANDKAYIITNARGTWNFADDATTMTAVTAANTNLDAVAQQIALVYHNSNYYLYSVNAGKYLTASNTLTSMPTDNEQVTITSTEDANYPWFFSFKNVSDKNINIGGSTNLLINNYKTLDAGNKMKIVEATDFDYTDALNMFTTHSVTYKLSYGGNSTFRTVSDVTTTISGDASEFVPTSFLNDCVSLSYSPETISSETTEVTVTATWNGPFELSNSFAEAKWYTVGIHSSHESSNYIWKNENNAMKAVSVATDDYASLADANCFAFVGNPYDGITIYNKAAGSSNSVYKANDANQATLTTTGTLFVPKASSASEKTVANGYCCFQVKDGLYYMNCYDNDSYKVNGWNSNDAGSTCWFIPAGKYYLNFIDGLCLDAPVGAVGTKEYFVTRPSEVSTFTTLRSIIENAQYSDITTLSTENVRLNPVKKTSTIALGDGYYRIVNACNGFPVKPTVYFDSTLGKMKWSVASNTSDNVNTIVRITTETPSIYVPNAQKYMKLARTDDSDQIGDVAGTTTFTSLGDAQYKITIGGQVLHSFGHNEGAGTADVLVGWDGGLNSASAWYIVKVSELPVGLHTIGEVAYATTCLPFDVTISDANAYTMVENGDWLVPTQLEGNQVPAGTAVLLKGTSATATATINTGAAFGTDNENALQGTYVPMDFALNGGATDEYFLGVYNGNIGFYRSEVESKDDYYTLGANKAYLLSASAGARGFAINWDDEVTGIRSIDNGKQSVKNGAIYDLSGRRVENPQRGMYIVNGRVVVVK